LKELQATRISGPSATPFGVARDNEASIIAFRRSYEGFANAVNFWLTRNDRRRIFPRLADQTIILGLADHKTATG
jgi:hypothetical protein